MKTVRTTGVLVTVMLISLFGGFAQQNDSRTLLTVADEEVPVSEFLRVYTKNNFDDAKMDEQSLRDYLELFINFKLKVKEAESLGMDTVTAFRDELAGYREQLTGQYFEDPAMTDFLVKEAWERKKEDIRASHILVRVGQYALPEDTAAAYNTIMAAYKRLQNGEAFEIVALDVSEDPFIRDRTDPRSGRIIKGNKGDLGYFNVFDMIYPFESAAYNTKQGSFSMPVRTRYGYHIIKVTDRIPAFGEVQLAHLYLKLPDSATYQDSLAVQLKADSLYQRIVNGEKYEDLVKQYSDDPGSAQRGGMLPKLKVNRLVPEFVEALKTLSDTGQVAPPVLTSFGWHILKFHSKEEMKSFEDVENDLKKTVQKDDRAKFSKQSIISQIRNEYGLKQHTQVLAGFYPLVDSSVYDWKWTIPENFNDKSILVEIGDAKHTLAEFAEYFANNQKIAKEEKIVEYVNKTFAGFIDECCIAYEDSKLEEKHPDFRALVKEYRDGILLFDLTEQNVWSKAIRDTAGLKQYYNNNVGKYMWGQRVNATVFSCADDGYAEMVTDLFNRGLDDEEIVATITGDSLDVVQMKNKLYSQNENDIIDSIEWEQGISEPIESAGRYIVVVVHGKVAPGPKSFDEAKGFITADYQTFLEDQWIKELRKKYPVKIHEDVFASMIR